ncbi:MAG: hypothetical protein ACJAS4_003363 [Bacteriovoracaceae bacterium]|jgi:hypothetical protein
MKKLFLTTALLVSSLSPTVMASDALDNYLDSVNSYQNSLVITQVSNYNYAISSSNYLMKLLDKRLGKMNDAEFEICKNGNDIAGSIDGILGLEEVVEFKKNLTKEFTELNMIKSHNQNLCSDFEINFIADTDESFFGVFQDSDIDRKRDEVEKALSINSKIKVVVSKLSYKLKTLLESKITETKVKRAQKKKEEKLKGLIIIEKLISQDKSPIYTGKDVKINLKECGLKIHVDTRTLLSSYLFNDNEGGGITHSSSGIYSSEKSIEDAKEDFMAELVIALEKYDCRNKYQD